MEDLGGAPVDLGAYLDGPALFEFWATWCENCEALAPQIERAFARFGDRMPFVAIGVGVGQSPRSIRRHLERHPAPQTFLFDARGRAVRAYRAPTTSYVVIVDAQGIVAYTGVGKDQDLEAAISQVLTADERR